MDACFFNLFSPFHQLVGLYLLSVLGLFLLTLSLLAFTGTASASTISTSQPSVQLRPHLAAVMIYAQRQGSRETVVARLFGSSFGRNERVALVAVAGGHQLLVRPDVAYTNRYGFFSQTVRIQGGMPHHTLIIVYAYNRWEKASARLFIS